MHPRLSAGEIHTQVATRWDLSGPVPQMLPGTWACPCGRPGLPEIHAVSFFEYQSGEHRIAHRANVQTWCPACGQLQQFGVPIPAAYYEANWSHGGSAAEVAHKLRALQLHAEQPNVPGVSVGGPVGGNHA